MAQLGVDGRTDWRVCLYIIGSLVLRVLVLVYSSLCVSFSPSSCSCAFDLIRFFCDAPAVCPFAPLVSCPYYNWVSLDLNIAIYICHTYYYCYYYSDHAVAISWYSSRIDLWSRSRTTAFCSSSPVFVFRLSCLYYPSCSSKEAYIQIVNREHMDVHSSGGSVLDSETMDMMEFVRNVFISTR